MLLFVPYKDCICAKDEIDLLHAIDSACSNDEHPMHKHIHAVRSSGSLSAIPLMSNQLELSSVIQESSLGFLHTGMIEPLLHLGHERWVIAYMLSRCFQSEREGFPLAAVPLADQFNHSSELFNTRLREVVGEGFCFYAERNVSQGEEILNNYGIDSGLEMFITHGFVDPANCMTEIVIPLQYLQEVEGEDAGDLIKIKTDDQELIPKELMDAIPAFPELQRSLKLAIKRGVLRFKKNLEKISLEACKLSDFVAQDISNCEHYLERLESEFHE